ncbi:MAG: beta-Ala-His dipeptidase [Erysipelotrichaceae bacterium]
MSVLNSELSHQAYFEAISKIPHGSTNEKALSDYLVDFAKQHHLDYVQDELYNVVIFKKASKGYETHDPIMLQAHIDMVCEKNQDVDFDFEKDALSLYIENGFLKAKGTTLGADDGAGVAYMMAILANQELDCPALECVFTTQEEIGMFGAIALDKTILKARQLINLDGGGEIQTLVSSSGGNLCHLAYEGKLVKNHQPVWKLFVSGLLGGHSGGEIDKERCNANKCILRILFHLMKHGELQLVEINGGLKDNAIPREASVKFTTSLSQEELVQYINQYRKDIELEVANSDPGIKIKLEKTSDEDFVLSGIDSHKIIKALYLLPNGMKQRNLKLKLVVTSLNLGVVTLKNGKLSGAIALRSAMDGALNEMMEEIQLITSLFDMKAEFSAYYPGWAYVEHSPLREKLQVVFQQMYQQELKLEAVHGGCECGLFKAIDEKMDIVTIGPITNDIHTPQEAMNLDSFDRTYDLLCTFLKEL